MRKEMSISCKVCGIEKIVPAHYKNNGKNGGRYCSRSCARKDQDHSRWRGNTYAVKNKDETCSNLLDKFWK